MDVFEAIRAYRPCRQYQSKPVPAEKVKAILGAARLAPSQNNLQPWRFVVVQDDEVKRRLAQACVRGKIVGEAPIVVVAFSVEEDIPVTVGGYISAYPLDVAAAVSLLQLAATAEGLGTTWMVDFHEDKVRTVLGVPEGIHPIAIVPMGFPAEPNGGAPRPANNGEGRKSPDEIISYNLYPW
jgi:nitroreductase